MEKSIAHRKLLFSPKGSSDRSELTVYIGEPYLDEEGVARCPVEWDGLFECPADIYGADLIHALKLAVDIDSMLKRLQDSKYDFYWPTGEPYFDGA